MASCSSSSGSGSTGAALVLASALGGAAAASLVRYILQTSKSSETEAKAAGPPSLPSPSDAVALIRHRRSIFPKQYSGQSLPRDVIDGMLEAARYAPSHKLTEAWRFVVFETEDSRAQLGRFMAEQYRSAQEAADKEVSQAKYDKKMKNCAVSSHVLAVVVDTSGPNPAWEEFASVAMAVQNMLLVAAAHGVGAYWSSGSVVGALDEKKSVVPNNKAITTTFNGEWKDLLKLSDGEHCLGLVFVGKCKEGMKWPGGKRSDMADKTEWR